MAANNGDGGPGRPTRVLIINPNSSQEMTGAMVAAVESMELGPVREDLRPHFKRRFTDTPSSYKSPHTQRQSHHHRASTMTRTSKPVKRPSMRTSPVGTSNRTSTTLPLSPATAYTHSSPDCTTLAGCPLQASSRLVSLQPSYCCGLTARICGAS